MYDRARSKPPRQITRRLYTTVSLLLTVLFFAVLFLLASAKEHLPFWQIPGTFLKQFYSVDKNALMPGTFLGKNIFLYFYFLFGLLSATAIGMLLWEKIGIDKRRLKEMIWIAGLVTFLAGSVFQVIHHVGLSVKEFQQVNGKTLEERIGYYFKNSYAYARYGQKHLPGKHWGRVVTDIDLKRNEAMFTFFGVAYYLYPIDIRVDLEHPKDCLVIFLKKNPLESVLGGYQAFELYDETSLIAIKKGLENAGGH